MYKIYIKSMISIVIQWVIISVVLIALIHYFFSFLKTNLTVPKVKDMINTPSKRYKDILDSIDNKKQIDNASNKMKDELKQYMASLMTNKSNKEELNRSNQNNDNFENTISNSSLDFSFS